LLHMEEDDDFILAVGSGTLNDTARFLSARLHIPYGIVCTAPSMDGYASTVSPMIIDRTKITLPGVFPKVIIADTALMKNAPMEMLHAGYGDVLGKFTALADWNLAKEQHGEYFCGESAALMNKALKRCTDHAAKLQERDEAAVESVTQGLLFAGIAMGLVGNSRPASGAEHHMAHFWEIALLQANLPHPLHGNCVGAAAVVSASIYEFFPELSHLAPNTSAIREFLHLAGCAVNPRELGISRELFHHSVLHAMEIRDRYTILRYGAERNRLPEIARVLTARFYD
ncbi:MAG: sn-glycerol-1-phosphate dehydrogenase, partial [Oscillospiraceae bacterium]